MEQADKDNDEELRARLEILREEMQEGRVKFSADLPLVMDSLKAVRYRPDGKVDLSTVDSRVRSLANMVSQFRDRREAKEAVSLQDLQRSYFTYIERNFGELYASMKDRGADPSKVGDAMASNPDEVKGFKNGMPEFLELIDDLWKQTWDSAYYHVQDLEGLKAVFGGETFPSARKNIVSVSGMYADTIVLPDPFLRTRFFSQQDDPIAVRWFVKSALSLLHYREAALADIKQPLVVIAPDATYVDEGEQETLLQASEMSILKHLRALFGVPFGSLEEAEKFLRPLELTVAGALHCRPCWDSGRIGRVSGVLISSRCPLSVQKKFSGQRKLGKCWRMRLACCWYPRASSSLKKAGQGGILLWYTLVEDVDIRPPSEVERPPYCEVDSPPYCDVDKPPYWDVDKPPY